MTGREGWLAAGQDHVDTAGVKFVAGMRRVAGGLLIYLLAPEIVGLLGRDAHHSDANVRARALRRGSATGEARVRAADVRIA